MKPKIVRREIEIDHETVLDLGLFSVYVRFEKEWLLLRYWCEDGCEDGTGSYYTQPPEWKEGRWRKCGIHFRLAGCLALV
jgi:hypothetical protein